ncbi:hypothetical protein D3C84_810880 [compost metagenome]
MPLGSILMVARSLPALALTNCTGVAKSLTSRRTRSGSGNWVLAKFRMILPSRSWISGAMDGSDRSITTLPSPWVPRWKSTPRIALPTGALALAGAALATAARGAWAAAFGAALFGAAPLPTTTNRLLPSTRVSYGASWVRPMINRVRSPASTTVALRALPPPRSRRLLES